MMYKELLSTVAILLTFIAFLPYIRSILQGQTRPHVFSWVIWGCTTFIVFLAQLADNAGAGAWPIGISGIITLYVAILAYIKKSDCMISRIDWLFFILAMTSLPFWYLTSDPLWAVVILTVVDVIGFGPSLRKAFFNPFEEHLTFFVIMALRNLIAILALENYTLTTVLFPVTIAIACLVLILLTGYRRQKLAEL